MLFIGLMSGTSADAVDAVLAHCDTTACQLIATHQHPLPTVLKAEIAQLSHPGDNEIERLGTLDRHLGAVFGAAVLALLEHANVDAHSVAAIGTHGQTLRHRPATAQRAHDSSFTLQIGDPNAIAEITGITTVADFRRRDIAAGGQGAPLAPAFHAVAFAGAHARRAILNIGGLANLSLLAGTELIAGFDTGPGNTLMDLWCAEHWGEPFDRDGARAASGTPHAGLLQRLLQHPYFAQVGPRSTGKEDFNRPWLLEVLAECPNLADDDVLATLCELTCQSICAALENSGVPVDEVFVCGGGAHNRHLMARLAALLAPRRVADTSDLGIAPDWVEATLMAWLASRTLAGLSGNSPAVTGARGERVLGAIYAGAVLSE